MGVFIAGFALCAWQSGRPSNPARGPRMIPWTLLAIFSATATIFLLAHVVNLLGFETGNGRGF
ncbi:MAG: hypothetical protein CMF74_09755 [Maricaulis sp.]|nr:hypothetical protein [Maricaulis sp.]HAQ36565.1 hypothetical protein [Alphaproteobacteria bacterium]